MGTINMLGLAKRIGAQILQASTTEVYGDPEVHPQTEDYWGNVNPIGIRSCYDEGKRARRDALLRLPPPNKREHPRDSHLQHLRPADAPVRRARGAQLHPAGPAGQDITIYGDGSQTRSFCYVDDLVDGIIA